MPGSFPPKQHIAAPACPSCGTAEAVIRMPDSLTPFERPNMRVEEIGGRYYCQRCGHDFEPQENAD